MKTAQETMQEIARDRDHKIRATVGNDEFRSVWIQALESLAAYEAELLRLAEIGKPLADRGITKLPPLPDDYDLVILSVRKGTMTPESALALNRLASAISNQEPVAIARGEFAANIVELVTEKFRSGNEIPVDQITIKRSEVFL